MPNKRWYKARPIVKKVVSERTGETYDSNLELTLHEGVLASAVKHPAPIPYTVEHNYHVDFVLDDTLYIETKGFFAESSEAAKYKWIRDALPEGAELVFIFEKPNQRLPWAKRRKDGTFLTHGEWATRNGFRSFGPGVTLEELQETKEL